MSYNIYSKRQQEQRGELPEIFVYDYLPDKLKVQIHHIIVDAIGTPNYGKDGITDGIYSHIRKKLLKEYGMFYLVGKDYNAKHDVLNFFLNTNDVEKCLDVIELCFRIINDYIPNYKFYTEYIKTSLTPDEAVNELNKRFKENGVGYVFQANQIIRIDSTYTHKEITQPVLALLNNPIFSNANEEYLKAHEHYRHGRNKECLIECLKSVESVIKIICKRKGWQYDEKDTFSKLIKVSFENGLIPSYLQNQFTSLKAVMDTGISTIRNKIGGHGQGDLKKDASDQLVRYALSLTGANIIFLVEQSGIT